MSFEGTGVGELVQDGVIKYLTREPLTVGPLTVYGVDWSTTRDKIIACIDEINKKEGLKAVVLHMNVTDKQTPFTDFTKDFLAKTFNNIHVWILGHYHVGSDPVIIEKKLFIDPWNLVRVARDYDVKMDKFDVNMAVLTVGEKLKVDMVSILHKPFREAFIEDYVNMLQVDSKDVFSFFKNINIEEALSETETDEQLLETLAQSANISAAGVQKAVEYLNGN